jgi:hypothetical protein
VDSPPIPRCISENPVQCGHLIFSNETVHICKFGQICPSGLKRVGGIEILYRYLKRCPIQRKHERHL